MTAFVWFHNHSNAPAAAASFYEKLLGWKGGPGPGGATMLAGAAGPFAGVGPKSPAISGWLPYAQVDDVTAATKKAVSLGAEVLEPEAQGPAGRFAVVRDPGGAIVALWQKG